MGAHVLRRKNSRRARAGGGAGKPGVAGPGLPLYLSPSAAPAKADKDSPSFLPDVEAALQSHDRSLASLAPEPTQGSGDKTVAAMFHTEPDPALFSGRVKPAGRGTKQYEELTVSAGGERGAVDMTDLFVFDPEAAPSEEPVQPMWELRPLPPARSISNPYPIQLSYIRHLSYADKKGRLVSVDVSVSLGFETATWDKQAFGLGLVSDGNQWAQVSELKADSASTFLTVDGAGNEDSYLAFAGGENTNASLNDIVSGLRAGGTPGSSTLSVRELADPRTGAGNQFDALFTWLDEVDAERYREAHPDVPWWKRGLLAMGGALYGFGNMFVEAGKQAWDIERLWVAVVGKSTGLWDYDPSDSMASGIGKMARQGKGTGEILYSMGEGMVKAPFRAWDAAKRGDWFAFGEEAMGTALALDALRGGVQFLRGARGLANLKAWGRALRDLRHDFATLSKLNEGKSGGVKPLDAPAAVRAPKPTNVRTMAGEVPPKGPGEPAGPGESAPKPDSAAEPSARMPASRQPASAPDARLAELTANHQSWIDQMRAATRGEGLEPPPWRGAKPQLDQIGSWRGYDPAEAYAAYRVALEHGGGQLEAIMARDRLTGEYHVMLGDVGKVSPPSGGSWETVVHYHPNLTNAPKNTLPAPHDASTALIEAIAGDPARPHVEFVESTIDGKLTRVAIVMGGEARLMQLELGPGVPGRTGPVGAGEVLPLNDLQGYQRWWGSQDPGTPQQVWDPATTSVDPVTRNVTLDPGGTRWVPPESQAYRNLMIDAAERFNHGSVLERVARLAPERQGTLASPRTLADLTASTESGAAAQITAAKGDVVKVAEPGSVYKALADLGLGAGKLTRLTLTPDESAQQNPGIRIVQGVAQMRAVLEGQQARLVGAFLDNGELLSPTMNVGARPYWIIVLAKNGDLWLIPRRLLDKGFHRGR